MIKDIKWFLSVRHVFDFDGSSFYVNKKGIDIIQLDKKGVDGVKAFTSFDSCGKILPTKHPNILHSLLKTKGSVNLHIKMFAEDRANALLPSTELDKMCREWNTPDWFRKAIEKQKYKIIETKKS